jgi:tetratricopeptide (TPR) repeat protein
VVLGYANTLSNLKEFDKADSLAAQALRMEPGSPSALNSRKFIRLGMAYGELQSQRFERAGQILQTLYLDYPGDADVLKLQADYFIQIRNFERARDRFTELEAAGDSLTAWTGMVLSWHLQGHPSKALELAENAWGRVKDSLSFTAARSVWERYIQALIWKGQYTRASREMDARSRQDSLLSIPELEAQWGMYTARFSLSEAKYRSILEKQPNSFAGNLGLANALIAQGNYLEGYSRGEKALALFEGHSDARLLVEKAKAPFMPSLDQTSSWSADNGNNTAYSTTFGAQLPFHPKWKLGMAYTVRFTENSRTGERAQTYDAGMFLAYRLKGHTQIEAAFSGLKVDLDDQQYTQPQMALRFRFKPARKQDAEMFYRRSVQTFNAELIARNIELNHFGGSYHLASNIGVGWYTQGIYNLQSDANSSLQVFSSFYALPLSKPSLKTGINVQYLGFNEQRPEIYFSPENYTAWDLFAEYNPKISSSTYIRALAASGSQQIDGGEKQWTLRAEFQFIKTWGKYLSTEVFGQYTSQASATASGFRFTQAGLRFRWTFQSPLFKLPASK